MTRHMIRARNAIYLIHGIVRERIKPAGVHMLALGFLSPPRLTGQPNTPWCKPGA
ncbi:hypothetical protein [Bradyrhizobium centrolobii]|uniref:hypothetical protein n=1 Tax=Bradyrhizobium centrolobii TaxID=1505087 RepID=UPI000A6B73FE|nr:hypothetical protein [Bradyrhizobium centrolobii]